MSRQNYNEGNTVTLPNEINTAQFGGENVNTALQNNLGNLSSYLQQTGGPEYYQGDPLAGFTDPQIQGQESLLQAAQNQQALADAQSSAIQSGLSGANNITAPVVNLGGYNAAQGSGAQIGDAATYNAQGYAPATASTTGYNAATTDAALANPAQGYSAAQGTAN